MQKDIRGGQGGIRFDRTEDNHFLRRNTSVFESSTRRIFGTCGKWANHFVSTNFWEHYFLLHMSREQFTAYLVGANYS
jgi:hypothetical protein